MKTIATTHTGGGGVDTAAKAAGLKPIWGVEIDGQIADWGERNSPGLSIIRASVEDVDYSGLEVPHWFHASPVCKNASVASRGDETEGDISQATGISRAITQLRPPMVSIENVWPYRKFEAFKMILRTLADCGYTFNYWHLNAADYGVPQTRKRLILVASRVKAVPDEIPQTHYKPDRVQAVTGMESMFWKPWNGWYGAIEDLIPELEDSEFAPWQLKRLPAELKTMLLPVNGEGSGFYPPAKPTPTITADRNQLGLRAFIVPGDNASNNTVRLASEPFVTVQARSLGQCPHRAFVPDKGYPRALAQGRIVKMSPRALARWQSVPDSYVLPDNARLAGKIIGNMVPLLLMQRVVEASA